MNTYRFTIPGIIPQKFLQKFPDLEAATRYAKEKGYKLHRHLDEDKEFYLNYFEERK